MNNRDQTSTDVELIAELQRTLRSDSMLNSLPTEDPTTVVAVSKSAKEDRDRLTLSASKAALKIADRVLGLAGAEMSASDDASEILNHDDVVLVVDGRKVVVPPDGQVIGRHPDRKGIVVRHPEVSRNHARFTRTADGIAVADLGSSNGTVVVRGGKRLVVEAKMMLLEVGDRLMTRTDVFLAEVAAMNQSASQS